MTVTSRARQGLVDGGWRGSVEPAELPNCVEGAGSVELSSGEVCRSEQGMVTPSPGQPWGRMRGGGRTGVRRYAAMGPWHYEPGGRRACGDPMSDPCNAHLSPSQPLSWLGQFGSPPVTLQVFIESLSEWSGLGAETRSPES